MPSRAGPEKIIQIIDWLFFLTEIPLIIQNFSAGEAKLTLIFLGKQNCKGIQKMQVFYMTELYVA